MALVYLDKLFAVKEEEQPPKKKKKRCLGFAILILIKKN